MSLLSELEKYYLATDDRHYHLYDFGMSPYESPIAAHPKRFGTPEFPVVIVDSFGGRLPAVLNYDLIIRGQSREIAYRPTFMLDSHLVSGFHALRTGKQMPSGRRDALQDFLRYALDIGFDFSPAFYLTEALTKSTPEKFVEFCAPAVESMLTLHSMDKRHFVQCGEVKSLPDGLDYYRHLYGAQTLNECAQVCVQWFLEKRARGEVDSFHLIDATYACLIKMTLLHKTGNLTIRQKMDAFETFVSQTIGLRSARETPLALYYFANLVGRFLPVQAGMSLEKAKRHLKATAWDLFLLRLPELLINPQNLPETILGYVCSEEKQLAELGSLFTVIRMAARSDTGEIIGPLLSIQTSLLEERLGAKELEALFEVIEKHASSSESRPAGVKFDPEQFAGTVLKLETELAGLCGR